MPVKMPKERHLGAEAAEAATELGTAVVENAVATTERVLPTRNTQSSTTEQPTGGISKHRNISTDDNHVVMLGNAGVGKTCLLISHTTNQFRSEYVPTVFVDDYEISGTIDGKANKVIFHDTRGSGFVPERTAAIDRAGVVVYVLSVVHPDSYHDLKEWHKREMKRPDSSRRHRILVGTQVDLRNDIPVVEKRTKNKPEEISREMGEKLAKELKAVKYVECSALTRKGLKNVFDEAIRAALEPPQPDKKGKCAIL